MPHPRHDRSVPKVAGAHRVLQAARDGAGNETVGRLYEALGTRWHRNGEEVTTASVLDDATAAGFDGAAAALADESLDAAVAAATERALELAGPDIGSPVPGVDGTAVHGPIIRALPDEAGSRAPLGRRPGRRRPPRVARARAGPDRVAGAAGHLTQSMAKPPLTPSVWPVTHAASSDRK